MKLICVSLRGRRPKQSRACNCFLWISSSLALLAMTTAHAQDVKMPHGTDIATGIITGKLLKDGKPALGGHQVVLEILNGHKVVLTIPKPTDNNGNYQFKNIFKSPEFAYSVSTEFEGKTYRTDFISLGEKDSKKVVDLIVGAGAKEGPALPPPMDEKTMMEGDPGDSEHTCSHGRKFSDYQLLAIALAIAAVGYAIYQRKRKK